MTHWIHGVFFHSWHFIYAQTQLTVWFGNIVAAVVTFLAVGMFWPGVRNAFKGYISRYFVAIHTKIDAQHKEHLALTEKHHREALALARSHHEAHMAAIGKPVVTPVVKPSVTVRKGLAVKKATKP